MPHIKAWPPIRSFRKYSSLDDGSCDAGLLQPDERVTDGRGTETEQKMSAAVRGNDDDGDNVYRPPGASPSCPPDAERTTAFGLVELRSHGAPAEPNEVIRRCSGPCTLRAGPVAISRGKSRRSRGLLRWRTTSTTSQHLVGAPTTLDHRSMRIFCVLCGSTGRTIEGGVRPMKSVNHSIIGWHPRRALISMSECFQSGNL